MTCPPCHQPILPPLTEHLQDRQSSKVQPKQLSLLLDKGHHKTATASARRKDAVEERSRIQTAPQDLRTSQDAISSHLAKGQNLGLLLWKKGNPQSQP